MIPRLADVKIGPERYPHLCAAAGALAFVSSLPGKLLWDSEALITQNAFLRSVDNLSRLWTTSVTAGSGMPTNYYRPVATTLLLFGYQLWGPNPFGYHLLNVLLHAANAALVYLVAERLVEDKPAALWIALLFAIHPIQTEQVNYPDHIEGILAMTFGLGAVLSYLRAAAPAAVAGFYALALLSKEEGAVFGPILGLLCLRGAAGKRRWAELAPAAGVAALYVVLRLTALNFLSLPLAEYGAQRGAYAALPLRLLTFAKALLLYVRLVVAPFGLHFDRTVAVASWDDWRAWGSATACAALFSGLWRANDERGRTGLLWFFAALLPFCGLVPFNNVAAEHFFYAPSVGLFIAVVPLARGAAGRLLGETARAYLAVALVAACLFLDTRRNLQWQNPLAIYQATLAQNPGSYRAATNLGVERFRNGDLKEAKAFFRRALAIKPDDHVALNDMGAVWQATGDLEAAAASYRRALELEPDYLLARANLAGVMISQKSFDEAIRMFEQVLARNPHYDLAWKGLGVALFFKGEYPRAQAALRRGLELAPDELTQRRLTAIEDALAKGELEHRNRVRPIGVP